MRDMDELPIACDRDGLGSGELTRQGDLWRSVLADVEERRELDDGYGYAMRLPVGRLADVAELMGIERRCCGFLKLRLDVEASEPCIWFTLSGPAGTKSVLDAELGLMLDSSRRSP